MTSRTYVVLASIFVVASSPSVFGQPSLPQEPKPTPARASQPPERAPPTPSPGEANVQRGQPGAPAKVQVGNPQGAEQAPVAGPNCSFSSATVDTALVAAILEDRAKHIEAESKSKANSLREQAKVIREQSAESALVQTFAVTNAAQRVVLHLANPPATRARVSFDSTAGNHVEVDWDPAVSSELTRSVVLSRGTWRVVASVEPTTFTQNAGSVLIHTRFGAFAQSGGHWTLDGTYVAMVAGLSLQEGVTDRELISWPHPRFTFECVALPNMEDAAFGTNAAAATVTGMRGFGVAPSAVTNTLSILAEIAIERAKAGAMRLLKNRLIDPFCIDDDTKVTLAKLGFQHSDALALPRTCEVLESMRLEDVLSSGKPLLLALRDDLRKTIAPAVVAEIARDNDVAKAALTAMFSVIDTTIDRGGLDALDAQLALDALGNIKRLALTFAPEVAHKLEVALRERIAKLDSDTLKIIGTALEIPCADGACVDLVTTALAEQLETPFGIWAKLETLDARTVLPRVTAALTSALDDDETARTVTGHACQARLVIATMKRCHRDGCSTAQIADMLSRPEEHFEVDTQLPFALCWHDGGYRSATGDLAEVQQLVIDGLRVVAPITDNTGKERAKAVVRVVSGLLERWQVDSMGPQCNCIDAISEIALALVDEEYGTALTRFVRLAERARPRKVPAPVRKLTALVGAVAAYATVYRETKDKDPEAAREARKQALNAIIDSATDRTEREDESIVSIGTNVGLSATWTDAFQRVSRTDFEPALRVPLGVFVDFERVWGSVYFRTGIQLADLGQFVRRGDDSNLDEVRWSDFVSPGIEVAVGTSKLERPLNLAFHLAYAPSIRAMETDTDGVWRFGVALSYYVPFFDLN